MKSTKTRRTPKERPSTSEELRTFAESEHARRFRHLVDAAYLQVLAAREKEKQTS